MQRRGARQVDKSGGSELCAEAVMRGPGTESTGGRCTDAGGDHEDFGSGVRILDLNLRAMGRHVKVLSREATFSLLRFWDTGSKLWPQPRSPEALGQQGEECLWKEEPGCPTIVGKEGVPEDLVFCVGERDQSCLFVKPTGHQILDGGAGCRDSSV